MVLRSRLRSCTRCLSSWIARSRTPWSQTRLSRPMGIDRTCARHAPWIKPQVTFTACWYWKRIIWPFVAYRNHMASEIWVIIGSDNVLLPDGTIWGQFHQMFLSHKPLTHWGRVTYICVSKLTIIGSDNGLLPGVRFTKPPHALRPVVDPSQK